VASISGEPSGRYRGGIAENPNKELVRRFYAERLGALPER
jgi:hypothetical protein